MHDDLNQPESNHSRDELPALSRGLKTLYAARVEPAANADDALLAEIRRHFAGTSSSPRSRWRTLPWAIAAVILISVTSWLIWPGYQPQKQRPFMAYQPGDLDRNGRIDILDALQLAGFLDSGVTFDPAFGYDVNYDGTFDQRDVDFIAMQAVRLDAARNAKEARS